jgi:hypothetical protein
MNQKPTVDMEECYYAADVPNREFIARGLDLLVQQCHAASYNRGWWHDPITGLSLIPGDDNDALTYNGLSSDGTVDTLIERWFPYVIGTKIALIHSEVSEGLEAYRVDAMDDKINFPGITAEMGDAVIRIADLMGCLQWYNGMRARNGAIAYRLDDAYKAGAENYDLGAAILAKLPVNAGRPDHDLAKRAEPGGKKF